MYLAVIQLACSRRTRRQACILCSCCQLNTRSTGVGAASNSDITCAFLLPPLLPCSTWKTYRVSKGAKFATQRKKQATELTSEMIARCGRTSSNTASTSSSSSSGSCVWQGCRSNAVANEGADAVVMTAWPALGKSCQQTCWCLLACWTCRHLDVHSLLA